MNKFKISENSLDLLLHLIHKNKIDIYDIPISLITEQYLEYLKFIKSVNIDLPNEFFIMAAKLIHIRSCALYVHLEKGQDSKEGITHILLDYVKTKDISYMLENRKIYHNPPETMGEDFVLPSFFELLDALKEIIEKRGFKSWQLTSMPDKREEVIRFLKGSNKFLFNDLFNNDLFNVDTPEEVMATFFALLDLMHRGIAFIYQPSPDESVRITLKTS